MRNLTNIQPSWRGLRPVLLPPLLAVLLLDPRGYAQAQAPAVGIGAQLKQDGDAARIAAVVPGSPAERAGLHAGDQIVAVDGLSVVELDLSAVVAKIRGAQGTTVKLTVVSSTGQVRQMQIVRSLAIPEGLGAGPQGSDLNRSPAGVSASTPGRSPSTSSLEPRVDAGAAAVKFVNWVEPKERSFSVEIPAGWQLEGGLNWLSELDPQGYVRVQSPDGKVQVFLGDPELLVRQVPNSFSRMQTGASEGQIFRTPAGGRAKMERFLTGSQYAKEHVTWRLCPNPIWVTERDLPDVSSAIATAVEPEAQKYNASITASAGEASFTCGTVQGAVFAATVMGWSRTGPVRAWSVFKVAGFRSGDPLRSMEARYIMEHMLATLTPNAAWTQDVERRTMEKTGAVISMQNAATQAQLAASRQQNETLAQLNHPNGGVTTRRAAAGSSGGGKADVNVTLGTKRVCDAIGRCATVSNDSDNNYMDHSGAVRSGPASGGPPDNSGVWAQVFVQRR